MVELLGFVNMQDGKDLKINQYSKGSLLGPPEPTLHQLEDPVTVTASVSGRALAGNYPAEARN